MRQHLLGRGFVELGVAALGMGKGAAAKERARQSLSRYPNGLYARQLREIAEAP